MSNQQQNYWSRTLRACYKEQTKVVWDNLGNTVEYNLDPNPPNRQTKQRNNIEIPEWAMERFSIEMNALRKKIDNETHRKEVSESTQDRLAELGYI